MLTVGKLWNGIMEWHHGMASWNGFESFSVPGTSAIQSKKNRIAKDHWY